MTYILGGISLFMFGLYIARMFNGANRGVDNAHDHYAAAIYLAFAIVCFVLY